MHLIQAARVVTEQRAKRLVHHRHAALANERFAEFPSHARKHGLGISTSCGIASGSLPVGLKSELGWIGSPPRADH
jgi:hypothetical protein